MIKKHFVILFISVLVSLNLSAQEIEKLVQPQRSGGMSLFEAFNNRQSSRVYSPKELDRTTISNLLWSAYGINREDGRRTVPSASNVQEYDIYLIMADGWYIYEPKEHALIKLGNEDLREHAGTQDFVPVAPVNLIYVADHERMARNTDLEDRKFYSATDVGFIAQNVYLFCASEGLATVVRGLVDRDNLHKVLKLKPSQFVILGQTVGHPGN